MFDYLKLMTMAPKLMGISEKILKIVKGEGDPGEIRVVIQELHQVLKEIPQLQGFLLLIEPLVAIIDKVGTEIFDKPGLLSDEEIRTGKALISILGPLLGEMETEMRNAAAAVDPDDVDGLV